MSIMWRYIEEESEVLGELLKNRQTDTYAEKIADRIRTTYMVCHGSSYNAAVCMTKFFAEKAGIRAYAYTPANFYHKDNPIVFEQRENTLVIVISQTGTSNGAIRALEYANSLGFATLSLTADLDSVIAKKADDILNLCCGIEESNAKTKGYSATLLLLMLLAVSIGEAREYLSTDDYKCCRKEFADMVDCIPTVRESALRFCRKNQLGENIREIYSIGSGLNYGTALEAQLKLMETMCIPTMFNDIGELSHGMHRAINSESTVILIKGADYFAPEVLRAYTYLKDISDAVWMIEMGSSDESDVHRLSIPSFPQTQSLLLTTLVVQIFSVFIPEYNKLDPNRDANNDFTIVAGTRG